MAVLPHAHCQHVFTNEEGKRWGHGVDLPSRNAITTILSLQHKGAVTVASKVRSLLVLDLYDSTLLTGCFLKSRLRVLLQSKGVYICAVATLLC